MGSCCAVGRAAISAASYAAGRGVIHQQVAQLLSRETPSLIYLFLSFQFRRNSDADAFFFPGEALRSSIQLCNHRRQLNIPGTRMGLTVFDVRFLFVILCSGGWRRSSEAA
jgi:hypothetical protein